MRYYTTTNRRGNQSILDGIFGDGFFAPNTKAMPTDIIDRGEYYDLCVEIPGYNKSNIALDYSDGYLTVSATRDSDADAKYLRRETATSCSRTFRVGELLESQLKAKYDNGVLVVSLPKEQPAKKSTTITID